MMLSPSMRGLISSSPARLPNAWTHGMGAYPDDPYYDPKRPGWLPYWIDTSTEEQAKFAYYGGYLGGSVTPKEIIDPESVYLPPPMPPPPPAPSGAVLTVPPASGVDAQATVDAIIARQNAEWKAANEAWAKEVQKNIEASKKENTKSLLSMDSLLIIGAVGIGALFLLGRR